jgi:UDP-N-acetylmuramate--alanine ligase
VKKPTFLKKVRRVHLTGIKGVGMTALACCLQDLGIKVTGSDTEELFVTDKILKRRGINWQIGFKENNLTPRPDLVITTGAHGGLTNPEVIEAKRLKIPVLTHAHALGKIMEEKEGISVCGVGGKTTTAAMIAMILAEAGRKPSYAIGVGEIFPLGAPGKYDLGREFVAEADEYANTINVDNRPRFSFQKPKVTVVTNIEYDHPDLYKDITQTKNTFLEFFQKIPQEGLLIASQDNLNIKDILKRYPGNFQTYGFSASADWHIEKTYFGQGQTVFNLVHQKLVFDSICLKIPGKFNTLNAAAAFAVGTFLGINPKMIKKGLSKFTGTKRRFEFIGEENGIKLYDDYAHDPHEIKTTLEAAKLWFPKNRLIIIFQPHTYSRTKTLFKEFSLAFSQADLVIMTDIYASAREKSNLGINSKLLVEETGRHNHQVYYQPNKLKTVNYLKKIARSGDIIITMGAGDIFQWHQDILESLKS